MILYTLDLLGVAVFAASGTLAGVAAGFDLFGVFVLATITAVGGGSMRDLLLGVRPVFWVADARPLYTVIAATALTLLWVRALPVPLAALQVADALGLAVFALSGAQVAEKAAARPVVIVLMGTLTGAGGGVLRDLLSGRVPLILQQDIYASAAMLGITVYLGLRRTRLPMRWAMVAGALTVGGTRLMAIAWGWQLPRVVLPA